MCIPLYCHLLIFSPSHHHLRSPEIKLDERKKGGNSKIAVETMDTYARFFRVFLLSKYLDILELLCREVDGHTCTAVDVSCMA